MTVKVSAEKESKKLYGSYVAGYVLSACLTLLAYMVAVGGLLENMWLVVALLGLALVQFIVQLFFFLHIGQETRPRWKQFTLLLMIVFTVILIVGSIWIIYNLNYRMMPMSQEEVNRYMKDQASSGF